MGGGALLGVTDKHDGTTEHGLEILHPSRSAEYGEASERGRDGRRLVRSPEVVTVKDPAQFPQFNPVALPCEGCGTDVVVLADGDFSGVWAEGALVAWCPECWEKRA